MRSEGSSLRPSPVIQMGDRLHPARSDPDADAPDVPSLGSPGVRLRPRVRGWFDRVDRLLGAFWEHPVLFGLLVIAALVSAVWGYVSFYGPQYSRVPWGLWLFVPDSPFALTLWLVAVLLLKSGLDRSPATSGAVVAFVVAWAAAVNVKIALWTPYVLLFYADVFFMGSPANQAFQVLLLVAHVGMVGYALLLMRRVRALPAAAFVGVLALLFLWDFMDYFFVGLFMPESGVRVYPIGIPPDGRLVLTQAVTLGLSLFSALFVWVGVRLRGPPAPR
jgi:uncharacterized membrane protein YpjA